MSTSRKKEKASILTRYQAIVEGDPEAMKKVEEDNSIDDTGLEIEPIQNEIQAEDKPKEEIDNSIILSYTDEKGNNKLEVIPKENAEEKAEEVEPSSDNTEGAISSENNEGEQPGMNGDENPVLKLTNTYKNMDIYKIDTGKLVDAPPDWNFFPPLPDVKFKELIHSIEENGLLVPLVVWDLENGKYMILGGHNRKRAYEELFRTTKDDKYKSIYCTVKGKEDIDNEDAKTIIIDTNFVQRDLSPSIKSRCIIEKYKSLGRKARNSSGKRPVNIIAEEYGLGNTQVFAYYKLRNLIPEIMRLIDENIISIKSGAILADLSQEFQTKLFRDYGTYLTNKRIMKINTKKNQEEILDTLTATDREYIKVVSTIPKNKYNEFIELVDKWMKQEV